MVGQGMREEEPNEELTNQEINLPGVGATPRREHPAIGELSTTTSNLWPSIEFYWTMRESERDPTGSSRHIIGPCTVIVLAPARTMCKWTHDSNRAFPINYQL